MLMEIFFASVGVVQANKVTKHKRSHAQEIPVILRKSIYR